MKKRIVAIAGLTGFLAGVGTTVFVANRIQKKIEKEFEEETRKALERMESMGVFSDLEDYSKEILESEGRQEMKQSAEALVAKMAKQAEQQVEVMNNVQEDLDQIDKDLEELM